MDSKIYTCEFVYWKLKRAYLSSGGDGGGCSYSGGSRFGGGLRCRGRGVGRLGWAVDRHTLKILDGIAVQLLDLFQLGLHICMYDLFKKYRISNIWYINIWTLIYANIFNITCSTSWSFKRRLQLLKCMYLTRLLIQYMALLQDTISRFTRSCIYFRNIIL